MTPSDNESEEDDCCAGSCITPLGNSLALVVTIVALVVTMLTMVVTVAALSLVLDVVMTTVSVVVAAVFVVVISCNVVNTGVDMTSCLEHKLSGHWLQSGSLLPDEL